MPYPDDTLLYEGRVYRLDHRPLEDWFGLVGGRPVFRGLPAGEGRDDYSATWELDATGCLQLVGITGCWPDATPVRLAHLFPLMGETVPADWFSGSLCATPVGSPHARTVDEPVMLDLLRGQRIGEDGTVARPGPVAGSSLGWASSLV